MMSTLEVASKTQEKLDLAQLKNFDLIKKTVQDLDDLELSDKIIKMGPEDHK